MSGKERKCWYCGEPAVEVWRTTWDEPEDDWPMCQTCVSQVRCALAHRAEGCDAEADAIDEQSGISTDRHGGQWIPPTISVAAGAHPTDVAALAP